MDLYERFEKQAFWGAALRGARAAGGLAVNGAKGYLGFGATQGATRAGRLVNKGATAASIGIPLAGSIGIGQAQAPVPGANEYKAASLDARLLRLTKLSFDATPKNLAEMAGYAAFLGAKTLPEDSPWHWGLDVAGLAALGATTGVDMFTNPHEFKPGVKDLVGLGLMGSALYDRYQHHFGAPHAGPAPSPPPSGSP